jgi:inosose dehydratase
MAGTGYDGAELPPAGFFGPHRSSSSVFGEIGLDVVGIYIPIHFTSPALMESDLRSMEGALDELESATSGPRIAILADEGAEVLLNNPGRGEDKTHALDTDTFGALTDSVNAAATRIRSLGLRPSFHPHISTYVESRSEIQTLLDETDIGLTFDTGHMALGGIDIFEGWETWRSRIDHIHLKNVRAKVMHDAKANARTDFDVWWADVATPLDEGDLDLAGFISRLLDDDYEGWVVVEQDRAPVASSGELEQITNEQARNLEWIQNTVSVRPRIT